MRQDTGVKQSALERRSAKVTTLLLLRCGAGPGSFRFYEYEDKINNHISRDRGVVCAEQCRAGGE
jgi:hypothetical protein